jgi:hypothetical protein
MLVFSNLEEPLDEPCGTLGFRGTPVEKHCSKGYSRTILSCPWGYYILAKFDASKS